MRKLTEKCTGAKQKTKPNYQSNEREPLIDFVLLPVKHFQNLH